MSSTIMLIGPSVFAYINLPNRPLVQLLNAIGAGGLGFDFRTVQMCTVATIAMFFRIRVAQPRRRLRYALLRNNRKYDEDLIL